MKKIQLFGVMLFIFLSCGTTNEIELGEKYEIDPYLGIYPTNSKEFPNGVSRIDTFDVVRKIEDTIVLCRVHNGQRMEKYYYVFLVDNFKKLNPKHLNY